MLQSSSESKGTEDTVIPVILGSGITLFGDLEKEILLTHIATKTFDFDFVQLTYEVAKDT